MTSTRSTEPLVSRSHASGTIILLIVAAAVLAAPACRSREDAAGPAIAKIGERSVYPDELGDVRGGAARRRALDAAIARVLGAQAARQRRLTDHAQIARQLELLRRRALASEEALLRDALYQSLRDELAPTEVDLRRHYEATKLRYAERQVRLRWWPAPSAAAARARADAEAAKLDRDAAATIGPVSVSDLPPQVVPEVFHLEKPGDRLAAGSETEGFGVVELAEVLPAVTLPFARVRDRVEESWRTLEGQRAFAKLIEELRAQADIEIDEAALANDALWEADRAPAPPQAPAAPPRS